MLFLSLYIVVRSHKILVEKHNVISSNMHLSSSSFLSKFDLEQGMESSGKREIYTSAKHTNKKLPMGSKETSSIQPEQHYYLAEYILCIMYIESYINTIYIYICDVFDVKCETV